MKVIRTIPVDLENKPRSRITHAVFHRLSLAAETPANPDPVDDDILEGKDVHLAFANHGLGTGGLTPYHILIRQDEVVEQLLPLSLRGSHAGNYNGRSWAVACVGNFDEIPMPSWTRSTLIKVLAILGVWDGGLIVSGHAPWLLPKDAKDPRKRCPGQHVDAERVALMAIWGRPNGYKDWATGDQKSFIESKGFTFQEAS